MNHKKRLREVLEKLFVSGADKEHSEDEMLSLLENVDYGNLLRLFRYAADPIYEYWSDGLDVYQGHGLAEYDGIPLFEDPISEAFDDKNRFQHSLELWLLSDMSLLVTSCYRVITEDVFSEYRTAKSVDWTDTDMDVNFVDLADNLEAFCRLVDEKDLPIVED